MKIYGDGIYFGKYKETKDGVHYRGRKTWSWFVEVIAGVVVVVLIVCAVVVMLGGSINLGSVVIRL